MSLDIIILDVSLDVAGHVYNYIDVHVTRLV